VSRAVLFSFVRLVFASCNGLSQTPEQHAALQRDIADTDARISGARSENAKYSGGLLEGVDRVPSRLTALPRVMECRIWPRLQSMRRKRSTTWTPSPAREVPVRFVDCDGKPSESPQPFMARTSIRNHHRRHVLSGRRDSAELSVQGRPALQRHERGCQAAGERCVFPSTGCLQLIEFKLPLSRISCSASVTRRRSHPPDPPPVSPVPREFRSGPRLGIDVPAAPSTACPPR
jgi:hypothetical protein